MIEGMRRLLVREKGLSVVGEAADGKEAFALIEQLRPTVALLDNAMPYITGIEVARRVRDAHIPTSIVIFSGSHEYAVVRLAVEAGVSGFVLKGSAVGEMIEAVRLVAAGARYFSPAISPAALEAPRARNPHRLTTRERDVLRCLAAGLYSKDIAAELQISIRTVESYRISIMDKTGIRHIPGLVKYALLQQLTSLE
jgi:DNA-binding NarL/FixJ family response regulator